MPAANPPEQEASARRLRRVVLIVALINLAYFFVENADAAKEIWHAARAEHASATP